MVNHKRSRSDSGSRVGLAGAGDVVSGSVNGFEQRRSGASGIQVCRCGISDTTGDSASQVSDDVSEEIVGDDHVVAPGVLHQIDAGGVDVVVIAGNVGGVGGHLVHRPVPQIPGKREYV